MNVHVRVLIWSLTQSVSVFVKQIRNEAHEYFRVTIEKKKSGNLERMKDVSILNLGFDF